MRPGERITMRDDQAAELGEAADVGLLLRAEDGAAYVIPRAALAAFRLSEEQRISLDTYLAEDGGDVQGHGQFIEQFNA